MSWTPSLAILHRANVASYTEALLWVEQKVRQPSVPHSCEKHESTRPHTPVPPGRPHLPQFWTWIPNTPPLSIPSGVAWTVHPLTISLPSAAQEGRCASVREGGNLITPPPLGEEKKKQGLTHTSVPGQLASFSPHKNQVVLEIRWIREFTSHESSSFLAVQQFTRGYKA